LEFSKVEELSGLNSLADPDLEFDD